MLRSSTRCETSIGLVRDSKHIRYRLADDRVLDAIGNLRRLAEVHLEEVGDLVASYLPIRNALEPVLAPELLERARPTAGSQLQVFLCTTRRTSTRPSAIW